LHRKLGVGSGVCYKISLLLAKGIPVREATKSQWRVLQNLSLTRIVAKKRLTQCLSGVCYKISLLPNPSKEMVGMSVSVACATKSLSYLRNMSDALILKSQWRVLQNLSLTI